MRVITASQPVDGGEAAGAVGERALAGQDNAVGAVDRVGVGGDANFGGQALALRGQRQAAGGGGEVAAAIVDDRNFHAAALSASSGRAVSRRA